MNIKLAEQIKQYIKPILFLSLILAAIMLLTWGISKAFSIPLNYLIEDSASVLGASQFIGFSTLIGAGILMLGAGAVILALTFHPAFGASRESLAVLGLALISLYLALDDCFLLHERVITGIFQVGERSIYLAYLIPFGLFVIIFQEQLFDQKTCLFFCAGAWFALSLAADLLTDKIALSGGLQGTVKIIEESCKMGGYLFWTATVIYKSRNLIRTGKIAAVNR